MNIYTHIAALILGVGIALFACQSCEEKPETTTTIKSDTILKTDTVIKEIPGRNLAGKGNGVIKYLHDTTLVRDTVLKFIATLDTIENRDTFHIEYHYPSSLFSYNLRLRPDSIITINNEKLVNTVVKNTITIPPPKLSFGLQFGVGYLVSFRTGQSALGGYFGIGGNYKL